MPRFRYIGALNGYARLQIYLQADDNGHSAGSAYTAYCLYGKDNKSFLVYPPLALHEPELTQEYHDIVAEAQGHLVTGTSGKIAAK